jgi:hypothetical protein
VRPRNVTLNMVSGVNRIRCPAMTFRDQHRTNPGGAIKTCAAILNIGMSICRSTASPIPEAEAK